MTTLKKVTITTTQELDSKKLLFLFENGLLSIKRSGAGLTINCQPINQEQDKNLAFFKEDLKNQYK